MAETTLLLELGCEEIPARMVEALAQAFAAALSRRLREAALLSESAPAAAAAWTPRRLIVSQPGVLAVQPDREEQLTGPPVRAGVGPDGAFTPQAIGFATKQGAGAADLFRIQTPKGEYVAIRKRFPGRDAAAVLAELVPAAFADLDLPRAMRWQTGASPRFIRPLRWVLALLGDQPLTLELAGLRVGAVSFGHRSLAPGEFRVVSAADFPAAWEKRFVLPEAAARRARIEAGTSAALASTGLRARVDEELLDTLVNLTEFPSVIAGEFDSAYLDQLPEEVLVTVMRDHQKYLAVEDSSGRLANRFLAVINLDQDARGLIRHGNERVLRARFNDARFFWDSDRKRALAERLPLLDQVTFHVKLGTYRQKSERLERLAVWLAGLWNLDVVAAALAARLAKCDLTADLVKEFTELQGVMGGRYAEAEGLSPKVADAIHDQYLPAAVQGLAPRTPLAAAVAIADKLDTIAGLFAIGEIPTGSADPFALRRQANGIVRTLMVHGLALDLPSAWVFASEPFPGVAQEDLLKALDAFMRDRIAFYLREVEGNAFDTVNAVLAVGSADVVSAAHRARALDAARRHHAVQFAQVAAALKRVRNIVKKEGGLEQWRDQPVDPSRFEKAEATLALAVRQMPEDGFEAQLEAIAALWEPLDRFFAEIRVNAEDPALRANRLALLAWTLDHLSRLADFAEIGG